jgi:hypothetical protein
MGCIILTFKDYFTCHITKSDSHTSCTKLGLDVNSFSCEVVGLNWWTWRTYFDLNQFPYVINQVYRLTWVSLSKGLACDLIFLHNHHNLQGLYKITMSEQKRKREKNPYLVPWNICDLIGRELDNILVWT